MILVIDIGNTSIKTAIVHDYKIIKWCRSHSHNFIEQTEDLLADYPEITTVAMCQVGSFGDQLMDYLITRFTVFNIDHNTRLPFTNCYKSSTLGNDRIALVSGAIQAKPRQPLLIIDAGTCITYDYIDDHNNYLGGAISPGLRLRYESLHNFTANLPLLQPEPVNYTIGNTTNNSIHSGIINGLTFEIDGCITAFGLKNNSPTILMTGGDADLLSSRLKSRFFATPFLLIKGIYHLYKYNINL